MATTIVTKNSSTAAAVPTAAQLVQGELAVNVADKRLYTEDSVGGIVELGTNPSTLTVTGEITANGGIALGDNDKATFGADDDLAIYSTGANGYIENETGLLILKNNSDDRDIALQSDDGAGGIANYLLADGSSGALKAYHYGAEKLATTATGIDVTGNASFADNGKATFGASDDLEIFHDGSNSIIKDGGTGNLNILAGQLRIKNPTDAESLIEADVNGAVRLYYDNAEKLATTAAGIDVTGTATMDGLVVDTGANSFNALQIKASSATGGTYGLGIGSGSDFTIYANGTSNNLIKATALGDISFYEDTGTTAKFFWDASAESLGLGTSTPTSVIDARASGVSTPSVLSLVGTNSASSDSCISQIKSSENPAGGGASDLTFHTRSVGGSFTAPAERMRIDSAGHAIIPNGVTLGTAVGVYNAAKTLDDYEEGTFAGTLTSSVGSLTMNTSFVQMTYTKVGRLVTIFGNVVLSSVSTPSGNLRLTGLPFVCLNGTQNSERSGFAVYCTALGASTTGLNGLIIAGESQVRLTNFTGISNADTGATLMQAGSSLTFNFSYQAA